MAQTVKNNQSPKPLKEIGARASFGQTNTGNQKQQEIDDERSF